jgi:hypothetical protein
MPLSLLDNRGSTARLRECDWNDIDEPGCYLHIRSGMLMRVFADELDSVASDMPEGTMRMVKLSRNPRASLPKLRDIASRHGYPARF